MLLEVLSVKSDITTRAEVSPGHCDSCVPARQDPTNWHIPGAKLAALFHREQANQGISALIRALAANLAHLTKKLLTTVSEAWCSK